MAAARGIMALAGVSLAALAALGGLMRSLGLAPADQLPREVFWTLLFILLVLGVVLLIFLPPSRKSERRVDLDRPVTDNQLVRPHRASGKNQLPVTRGVDNGTRTGQIPRTSGQQQARRAAAPPRASKGSAAAPGGPSGNGHHASADAGSTALPAQPGPGAPPGQGAPAGGRARPDQGGGPALAKLPPSMQERRSDNQAQQASPEPQPPRGGGPDASSGHTSPNQHAPPSMRAVHDEPAPRPGSPPPPQPPQGAADTGKGMHLEQQWQGNEKRDPEPRSPARLPGATTFPAENETPGRSIRRREELENRLESLEQRANAAKVSLGLGRISHAGYRQYIKEVERERTLIESELMTLNSE